MIQSILLPASYFPASVQYLTSKLNPPFKCSTNANTNKIKRSRNVKGKVNIYERQDFKEPHIGQLSGFCKCGRRHFLSPAIASTLLFSFPSFALEPNSLYMETINKFHPPRPDWYEELYASVLHKCTNSYEAEIAAFKSELFSQLKGQAKDILEIGIGTGPNLKFYASDDGVRVIGVDPNRKMEKYAREAAEVAGLPQQNFEFLHAVGEVLPVEDASVDAVIGTLVLCSVKDIDRTLQEVKRVLKPGGLYLFVEHVGAEQGTFLRFSQNILNPLQKLLADNCHLNRETGRYIAEAGFSDVKSTMTSISSAFVVNPQVYGIARK